MKQRTIKELLILLREYIVEQYNFWGMCIEITEMYVCNLISFEELEILEDYFKNNKPENINGGYWWEKGDKQPRLDWIDEQLKKYNYGTNKLHYKTILFNKRLIK